MHLETVASLMNQSIGFRIKQNQNCLFRGYVVPLPRFVFRGLVPLCKFISINHNNLPCLSSLVKSGILFEKIIISTWVVSKYRFWTGLVILPNISKFDDLGPPSGETFKHKLTLYQRTSLLEQQQFSKTSTLFRLVVINFILIIYFDYGVLTASSFVFTGFSVDL